MQFSRQESWNGWPLFPSQGIFPTSDGTLVSLIAGRLFTELLSPRFKTYPLCAIFEELLNSPGVGGRGTEKELKAKI